MWIILKREREKSVSNGNICVHHLRLNLYILLNEKKKKILMFFLRPTSMDTEVAAVFIQRLEVCDIWGALYDLVHPLDGSNHLISLLLVHDRWAFVLRDISCQKNISNNLIKIEWNINLYSKKEKREQQRQRKYNTNLSIVWYFFKVVIIFFAC